MSVWFGFHLPSFTHPETPPDKLFDRVVEQAQAAEQAGFDLVTVMDHLYQIGGVGTVDEPMLEGWLALAALARETKRVRLGTLVTGVTYRNPAMLAKEVTTLDTISGGRAILGIGAAWNDVEHAGYGFEFPPVGQRMDRLEEALAIIKAMFTEDRPSFHGEHYQIERTLRIAAKYADMTHWFAMGLETLKHKTEVLERHCEAIGRDPSTIERTMGAPGIVTATDADTNAALDRIPPERRPFVNVGPPDKVAEGLRPYIEAGFTGFTFNNNLYRTPEQIALVGDLLRLVAGEAPVGAR
jgi:alkanesulfonate monooxygenase SsuD/methylene tetrahydromethanopterin reductase-like flavin-dependent oxidoreductase (luciferase family)